jgi:hypothetical protein
MFAGKVKKALVDLDAAPYDDESDEHFDTVMESEYIMERVDSEFLLATPSFGPMSTVVPPSGGVRTNSRMRSCSLSSDHGRSHRPSRLGSFTGFLLDAEDENEEMVISAIRHAARAAAEEQEEEVCWISLHIH